MSSSRLPRGLIATLFAIVLVAPSSSAQNLVVEKSLIGDPVVEAGETFSFSIFYSCQGTTSHCYDATITDTLPANPKVEFVTTTNDPNTVSVDTMSLPDGRTVVTYSLENPKPGSPCDEEPDALCAGTAGQVTLTVRFPNGETIDNAEFTNEAFFDADDSGGTPLPGVSDTAQAVTGSADAEISLNKTLVAGGGHPRSVDLRNRGLPSEYRRNRL